jgi:hypothetical protein
MSEQYPDGRRVLCVVSLASRVHLSDSGRRVAEKRCNPTATTCQMGRSRYNSGA